MPFLYSEGRTLDQSPVRAISAPLFFFVTAQEQQDTKQSSAVTLTLLGEPVPQLLLPHDSTHHKRCIPSLSQGDRDHQSQRILPSSLPLRLPTERQLLLPGLEISPQ